MAQISFRVDNEDKIKAEETLNDIGISMSAILKYVVKTIGRERRIPFELEADPFYSAKNQEVLRKSMKQMEETGGTVHEVFE
ncbi:MAG: type II toxin-antitoxin system RelB/DinJ family antitoxin [Lachnospiraceae bacterium]|jgi:DNA-damage-inducible protein J|nr:type II toxin-antitoxin system RelB/DinJ family antitoxin [Lachnospiraceae bacterium]